MNHLFDVLPPAQRTYGPFLTVDLNGKGVLDVDTVKGCACGMAAYPNGGCYGECYAYKTAHRYGIDFSNSVTRHFHTPWHRGTICKLMAESGLSWYRIGTAGDPCHDWQSTLATVKMLWPTPEGEINSLPTYESFRDTLFAGYKLAIEHLNDGCFFAIMTGDSRDNKGAYYCSEAETELFLKEQGLSVYNRIVYVEGSFTRLAQAKVTLNTRKFPKCEQKIIVAYKGDMAKIGERFAKIGRL